MPSVHSLPGNPLCEIMSCHPMLFINLALTFPKQGAGRRGYISPSPHWSTSLRSCWRPLPFAHIYTEQSWGAGLWPDFARLFQHLRVLTADQPWIFLNPGLGQPLCHIMVGAWTECMPNRGAEGLGFI